MSNIEVPFIKPHLPSPQEVAEDYGEIIRSNWFTNFGPFEQKLCNAAENYLDNGAFVTSVTNATLGLDLAIRALIGENQRGKTVLMPSFTFAAGAEVIISNGLVPAFIDIDRHSLQPSLKEAEEFLSKNRDTSAGILLCNIFGTGNQSIDQWEYLAKEYEIPLIIDTAAGFGSRYSEDEKVGARGDCEVFSLHATKPFSVGEGGLITSRDESLIKKIRQLQNFGFGPNRVIIPGGTNAKMQEISAAIGVRQLVGFEERLSGRRSVLDVYKTHLTGYDFQQNDSLSTVAFASVIAPDAQSATNFRERLSENGVEARTYYEPLHFQSALAERAVWASNLLVTEDVASRIVSLPVHDNMSEDSIQRIIDSI